MSPARRYRNLVTVFFLCGLWHGASWNFVIWGLWHGSFLVIERLSHRAIDRPITQFPNSPASGVLAWPIWPHVYTLAIVMIGWVFFRAETLPGAIAFLKAMAGLTAAAPTPYTVGWYLTPELWLALVAGAIGSTPWVPALAARLDDATRSLEPAAAEHRRADGAARRVDHEMAARTYNPFIYFRF